MHRCVRAVTLAMALIPWFVVGCGGAPTLPNPLATPTLTPTATPTATPTPVRTATRPTPVTPTPNVIDLVWWTPVWFSPESGDAAGDILAQRVAAFEEAHPGVRVHAIVKPPYGRGGLKDYLQGAYKVAPSLLPDVAAIDMADVPALVDLGIFQPLEGRFSEDLVADLYPFSQRAGTLGGHWLAVQFEANFQHLVYYQDVVSTPPATWDALLNTDITYLAPIFESPDEVSEAVLLQYGAAGGALPIGEAVDLNDQALLSLFNFYDQAVRRGLFPAEALKPQSADTTWTAFQERKAAMTNVDARRFLREAMTRLELGAAPVPTWDGKPFTLTRGWGLVMTTTDPRRQEAALAFMTWLLDPQALAAWTQAAGYIPARRSALQAWQQVPESYLGLLDVLLQRAQPYPSHPSALTLRRALAVGLTATLLNGEPPENAVRQTQEAFTP